MPNAAIDILIGLQAGDGGFGAYPGGESRTEATALAGLALHRSGEPDAGGPAAAAVAWLERTRLPSGAWPLSPSVPPPHWSTSLSVLCLSFAGAVESVRSGVEWLLEEEGQGATWWASLLFRLFPQRKSVDLDASLIGWPWASGTFSWVEPTAYAMMALKRHRVSTSDSRLAARIDQGERMLADRACFGGGWNYGNKRVFGEELWPYPDTTSVALLALADRSDLPQVADALGALPPMLEENGSVLSLSLGALALAQHGRDATDTRSRLTERIAAWNGGEIRALSWAALALTDREDVLGVSGG